MSNEKAKKALPFLLDDAAIIDIDHTPYPRSEDALKEVRRIYESARQQDKDRIEELTGLVQGLVDALDLLGIDHESASAPDAADGHIAGEFDYRDARSIVAALSKAKQSGFTPNT